ncbi:putative methyltransferase C1B3.06c [Pseudocercospora fuligena]|uniref:Putative methyltransferase C1B3.06c n=1 Tax=Pseudocercospora fuligena TaxID=685502 RepID=A0A8H6VL07_9PEZI|nr:putative methyltransferase C1B3.06c [Pseudocercospora fuligena]
MASQKHHAYVPGYKQEHIRPHAWRTAKNSAAYLLPKLQEMSSKKPDLQLLDCGAGPGTVSASFAKLIPQGTVVATDLSEEIIIRAKDFASAEGITNMRFQAASIYELPFEDNSFDIVHAHQVLIHLDEPPAALKEMLRVCKPGGIVASRDFTGSDSYYPQSDLIEASRKLSKAVGKASGRTENIGVRLVSLAMQAGVSRSNIQASMSSWCYSTPEERDMWGGSMRDRLRSGGMRKTALEQNLGWTEKDMDDMANAWQEWIDAEDGVWGLMNGEVNITKP